MKDLDSVLVIPEPSRLLEGLRDTGYDFNTAVADIIDNSIAAHARVVSIHADIIMGQGIRVSIADNGEGMDYEGLINAMRYGAAERKDSHSLGKFGLGLKTASTSCCRRLKVISRDKPCGELLCAVWDLDYIARERDWKLKFETPTSDDIEEFDACSEQTSGTLVVWEKCDRLLSARYSNPNTLQFKNAFDRSLRALKHHIAMVYQRFLDHTDARAQNINIFLNNERVDSWDPFCKEFGPDLGVRHFKVEEMVDSDTHIQSEVTVAAYIVPAKQELSSKEEKQRVMPSYGNEDLKAFGEESLSGFYIYRENRLIHWGDWFGMPGIDFHQKLCRFELSFGEELDDVFQVDIKKSRIQVNGQLRTALHEFVGPIKNEGDKRYRGQKRRAAQRVSKGMHEDANAQLEESQKTARANSEIGVDEKGNAVIKNRFGVAQVPYEVLDDERERPIRVEDSLVDGLLWMPAFIGDKHGVQLNSNHPFYQKFYALNKKNASAVQGMDSVFLAFAIAETAAWQQAARENLEDARYEASRLLRKYADALPEVTTEDIED